MGGQCLGVHNRKTFLSLLFCSALGKERHVLVRGAGGERPGHQGPPRGASATDSPSGLWKPVHFWLEMDSISGSGLLFTMGEAECVLSSM